MGHDDGVTGVANDCMPEVSALGFSISSTGIYVLDSGEDVRLISIDGEMIGSTLGVDDGDTFVTYEGTEIGSTIGSYVVTTVGTTVSVTGEANDVMIEGILLAVILISYPSDKIVLSIHWVLALDAWFISIN